MDIAQARKLHERELLRLPNVVGVGIGERAGEQVIKVYVGRKLPDSELDPSDRIPKSIEGWPTEVEAIGIVDVC